MMPKGVDHLGGVHCFVFCNKVQKSLMPKGVDHASGQEADYGQQALCKNL